MNTSRATVITQLPCIGATISFLIAFSDGTSLPYRCFHNYLEIWGNDAVAACFFYYWQLLPGMYKHLISLPGKQRNKLKKVRREGRAWFPCPYFWRSQVKGWLSFTMIRGNRAHLQMVTRSGAPSVVRDIWNLCAKRRSLR